VCEQKKKKVVGGVGNPWGRFWHESGENSLLIGNGRGGGAKSPHPNPRVGKKQGGGGGG